MNNDVRFKRYIRFIYCNYLIILWKYRFIPYNKKEFRFENNMKMKMNILTLHMLKEKEYKRSIYLNCENIKLIEVY